MVVMLLIVLLVTTARMVVVVLLVVVRAWMLVLCTKVMTLTARVPAAPPPVWPPSWCLRNLPRHATFHHEHPGLIVVSALLFPGKIVSSVCSSSGTMVYLDSLYCSIGFEMDGN